MKKILVFSLAYYPSHVSGAEAAIKEITDRISPTDIEFRLITLRFDKNQSREEKIGNVNVYRVGIGPSYLSKISFIPLSVLKALTLNKLYKFDAMWGMMTYMTIPIAICKMVGLNIPYVITLQDGDPYEKVFGRLRIKLFLPLVDYGFRNASVVQAISSYLAKWPKLRGSNASVELIYNGANPKDIADSTTKDAIDECHKKLNKKDGDVFLVNTARLVHQKGNDSTIRALKNLPENIKLVLVGGGEDQEMLKALAEEIGVGDRVIFVGQVDRSEVTVYRKACDIFVAPSRSEGLGNAFLSAMASRLPVVATQEGGLAEFIFDPVINIDKEQTAWVVEKDSPEQIVEAVLDIINNKSKVSDVTERARNMVLEKFNWDSVAKDMKNRVFDKMSRTS